MIGFGVTVAIRAAGAFLCSKRSSQMGRLRNIQNGPGRSPARPEGSGNAGTDEKSMTLKSRLADEIESPNGHQGRQPSDPMHNFPVLSNTVHKTFILNEIICLLSRFSFPTSLGAHRTFCVCSRALLCYAGMEEIIHGKSAFEPAVAGSFPKISRLAFSADADGDSGAQGDSLRGR